MYPDQLDGRKPWTTRRTLLRQVAAVGVAGAFAGCVGGDSSPPASDGDDGSADRTSTRSSSTSEPATDGSEMEANGAAPFDCGSIPTSLSPFETADTEFSFACDAPPQPAYGVATAEDAVERLAEFYFSRDGTGSINDWDFTVELGESVDTYGSVDRVLPQGTEVFSIEFAGETVPVRHHAITDDQDVWVLGLPADDAVRLVRVGSAVMPGQFGCHETVRGIARAVVKSVHPR